ncbi:MAG TPA: hypothetical protein VKB76_01415 [Ktedonobacterales bacterium]|nr:hypothetical protein [Ktedonobacterales bacterium]
MNTTTRRLFGIASLAAAATLPAVAIAAGGTAFEKAELAQLTPQLRAQVRARLTKGETVRGILETMLLNNISQLFAVGAVKAVDFEKGIAVVATPNGEVKIVPFEVSTLVVKA